MINATFVANFFQTLGIQVSCKSINRLGHYDDAKKRPIKIVMKSIDDKNQIKGNLRKLKNNILFKGFSVTDDYSVMDRQKIKEWSNKAKVANENKAEDATFVFRVRGDPKNGLYLKKFLLQNRV